MANSIEQGCVVVYSYVTQEVRAADIIESDVSRAIKRLNSEGKRVVNVSAAATGGKFTGAGHITYLLWEKDNSGVGKRVDFELDEKTLKRVNKNKF